MVLKVNADSDSDDSTDDADQRPSLDKVKKISNKTATFSITNMCSTLPIQFSSCVSETKWMDTIVCIAVVFEEFN